MMNSTRPAASIQQGACALTRAHFRAPFSLPRTLEPKGFQPPKWVLACHIVPKNRAFCPGAVPVLSRRLSRWFVFVVSGLGGLSRCPGEKRFPYMCVRMCAHDSGTAVQAGQRDYSSFFSILSNNINKIDNNRSVPQSVPVLSRTSSFPAKSLKMNKIMGFYCHD